MIRRLTDINSPIGQAVLGLRQQFLETHPHELWTPMEQLVAATRQGLFVLLSLEVREGHPVGFAVLHPYHWAGTPVLWLDEVYIEPGSRGQGLFEQFVTWCGHYCQISGVPTLMTNVWNKAEGNPFTKHVGAEPVVLTLRMTNPTYRPTVIPVEDHHDEHPDPDSSGNGEPAALRKKPRPRRRTPADRPRYPEGLAREVSE